MSDKKLNVLEVMSFKAAYGGNFLRSMAALGEAVEASGGSVTFVFPKAAEERAWAAEFSCGRCVRFVDKAGGLFSCAKELKNIIVERKINVIHTHFADKSLYLPLRLARVGKKIPLFYHAHSEPKKAESAWRDALKKQLIGAKRLLCVSEAVAEKYRARGFDCRVVANGIDFSRLDSYEPFAAGSKKSILMFGYDFKIKGIDTALDAMESCGLKNDFCLLICSAYPEKAIAQLEERFGSVPDFVRVLPPREDVAAYYHAASVFLSASRTEGMSYALAEAAYCGIPIAASNIPQNLESGFDAAFFETENAAELARAVRLADSFTQAEIAAARAAAIENFSLSRFAEKCLQELR